jgi:hypothetical protein
MRFSLQLCTRVQPSLLTRSPSLLQAVAKLAEGNPVFTADHYSIDPLQPGKVLAFLDHNGGPPWKLMP